MSLADCPSNLKEAIDWILRVTGKDGGGSDNTRDLAKAVKGLLHSAISDVDSSTRTNHENRGYLNKLKTGLEKAKELVEKDERLSGVRNIGPIGRLSRALGKFIGYDDRFIGGRDGHITGAGIAPSNIATHRLCDATIALTIGVLEGFKGHHAIKSNGNLNKVNTLITKLHEQYGKGAAGLQGVAQEVESGLNGERGTWPGLDAFVNDVRDSFKTNLRSGLPTDAKGLAGKVEAYLKGVFKDSWGSATALDGKLTTLISNITSQNTYNPSKFNSNEMNDALNPNSAVKSILDAGKNAFIDQLKKRNYESYHKVVTNDNINTTHAQIFLGCLPLYYQALTYIYWRCHENGGGWNAMTLGSGALRYYFDSQGLLPAYVDSSKRGAHIAETALGGFSEFKTAATSLSAANSPYVSFTKELQDKVKNAGQVSSNFSLSALYHGASCYFQCQQIKVSDKAFRTPKTIREMLYFLGALQFSSAYDEINGQIGTLLTTELSVADSNISSQGADTLSSDQLKEYLRASCAFSSSVLGMVQGPGASKNTSEPWLFELFCNSAFQFKYPSGPILFITVSNYAYALQFQLLFLYFMCSNDGNKCGWNNCTYGKYIKGSDTQLASHICPGLKCQQDRCDHKKGTNKCNHNNYDKTGGCGQSPNPSGLQAFLTDGIQGMCRQHPGSSYHLATCSGSLCHVPMGFEATHLRQNPRTGNLISLILQSFCGTPSSPLRQLSEKLGCLTKRTPRTLGDLFGFLWHLNGQLFNQKFHELLRAELQKSTTQTLRTFLTSLNVLQPPSLLSNSIAKLAEVSFWNTPDSYGLASLLATNLFSLNQHCHKESNGKILHNTSANGQGCTTSPNDLWSLYQPITDHNNKHSDCARKSCGGYFYPLTHSEGATYAPRNASTYLSWVLYLSDDLQSWFQEMLNEFTNIDCKKTGCRKFKSGTHACQLQHPGTHGNPNICTCDSVVHCGGVLPVLYRYGFKFYSPYSLSGETGAPAKRTCDKFHTQLSNVLSTEAPLTKLLTTIDQLLYLFRFYFFYNLSSFWLCSFLIFLYFIFYDIDVLHFQSHVHLPSSHTVPPLALLTTGKARALTKLTYYLP
ncbi:variant erythrocyte surface antigen-1 family protein [Babesia caballi]|uniref:Variant erythrocyte surface antigen-1 family protein n=1 Tax=Babesia caballi TaxID=5871 RepID=A0AAV4LRI5_BABCB|nr:variant erythrocyte surface antigen-1 family protein [Babesia caballi]